LDEDRKSGTQSGENRQPLAKDSVSHIPQSDTAVLGAGKERLPPQEEARDGGIVPEHLPVKLEARHRPGFYAHVVASCEQQFLRKGPSCELVQ
jgi:hypothetical protein